MKPSWLYHLEHNIEWQHCSLQKAMKNGPHRLGEEKPSYLCKCTATVPFFLGSSSGGLGFGYRACSLGKAASESPSCVMPLPPSIKKYKNPKKYIQMAASPLPPIPQRSLESHTELPYGYFQSILGNLKSSVLFLSYSPPWDGVQGNQNKSRVQLSTGWLSFMYHFKRHPFPGEMPASRKNPARCRGRKEDRDAKELHKL